MFIGNIPHQGKHLEFRLENCAFSSIEGLEFVRQRSRMKRLCIFLSEPIDCPILGNRPTKVSTSKGDPQTEGFRRISATSRHVTIQSHHQKGAFAFSSPKACRLHDALSSKGNSVPVFGLGD